MPHGILRSYKSMRLSGRFHAVSEGAVAPVAASACLPAVTAFSPPRSPSMEWRYLVTRRPSHEFLAIDEAFDAILRQADAQLSAFIRPMMIAAMMISSGRDISPRHLSFISRTHAKLTAQYIKAQRTILASRPAYHAASMARGRYRRTNFIGHDGPRSSASSGARLRSMRVTWRLLYTGARSSRRARATGASADIARRQAVAQPFFRLPTRASLLFLYFVDAARDFSSARHGVSRRSSTNYSHHATACSVARRLRLFEPCATATTTQMKGSIGSLSLPRRHFLLLSRQQADLFRRRAACFSSPAAESAAF